MQAQAFGDRQDMAGIDHHFFGHAATCEQCANPVANTPVGARADLRDHSRAFQAKVRAGTGGRRVQACALEQVSTVESRCSHTDPDLTRITGRALGFYPGHMSVNALQCLHSASIVES
ncbi:hypothetical protein KNHN1_12290 [Pseudomonas guariconensis]